MTKGTTIHMGATIPFFIELCRAKPDEDIIEGLKGEAAIKALLRAQAAGYRVIPLDSCDNQATDGHCLGHPTA